MSQPRTQPADVSSPAPRIAARGVARMVLVLLILPLLLFVAAGDWRWWQGWVYIGAGLLFTVLSRALIARRFPDLIVERSRALEQQDAKPWDRLIVPLVTLAGPLVEWIVAGLDHRWGWSAPLPAGLWWGALALLLAGYAIAAWAMLSNRWFSGTVRIQTDRGHRVVATGPYRYVRHPGYVGGIVGNLASMLVLESWWALIPATLVAALTVLRTALEDRTLQAELPGYIEYTEHTKYRLLPGVW